MKLTQKILLSLASMFIVSCATEVSKNQPAESMTPSTQTASSVELAKGEPSAVKSGTFVAGEHETKGTVRIVTKNGKSFLELNSDFQTSNSGPDLFVILHKSDNVLNTTKPPSYPIKKGEYAMIAPLQKYNGAQSYAIPENIDLAQYKSTAIWCRQFNATFGTASLSS
ncbi:MAG: DM13 domain-containing protein [Scytonema sp. PMC 1069.18]|nr:DM13 domain-containing protein [Scytonema sp. PMC 1069.18]MEC4881453.1 DM13 domain-containing protein [Scytonema sp. PMC 1070.18]